jgi:hypothetical protein
VGIVILRGASPKVGWQQGLAKTRHEVVSAAMQDVRVMKCGYITMFAGKSSTMHSVNPVLMV